MSDGPQASSAADFLSKWVETFNADKSKLTDFYAPDGSLHGTSSPELFIGRDRIRTYFHGGATVEVQNLHCSTLANDTALLIGHCVFSSEREGKPIQTPARFTFLLRQENSDWQILHHHSSANPL